MIELRSGQGSVGLLPEIGAALAWWRRGEADLLHPTSDPNLQAQRGVAVAGYPLIPYSNRIGSGRFTFEGTEYHLTPNMLGEPHSIHGNAWQHAWTVAQQDVDRAILVFDHNPESDKALAEWPFPYRAVLSFILTDLALQVEILVANRSDRPQPIGFGYHPFFRRTDDMQVEFVSRGVWDNNAVHLPGHLLPAKGEWDFSSFRDIGKMNVDHCFAGWRHEAKLRYPEAGYDLLISATDDFSHLVLFTSPEKPFVALEAVTNMNNAINRTDVMDGGLKTLASGQTLSGTITYRIASASETGFEA